LAFSRRMFLRHGVFAAAAACASSPLLALGNRRPIGGNEEGDPSQRGPSAKSGNWQDHAAALDNLGRASFSGAIGTNFKVFLSAVNSSPVWVTLLAVQDLPKIAPANVASFAVMNKKSGVTPTSSGFLLVFGGSSALPQSTNLFEHDALGRFALFTVPEGNGQQLYTAVINRLDGAHVIAVPYATGKAAQQNAKSDGANIGGANADGIRNSSPTSLTDGTLSPGLSGSQGARRGAVRD
jgi:hypothetical protein